MSKMDKLRGAINKNESASVERAMNSIINNDIREVIINFNYSNLNLDLKDLEELQEHEKALLMQGKSLNRIAIKIGEHLHKAREIFIKSHSESFMEWYEALGLKKDQVSIFMNRFRLTLEYPEAKEKIITLNDRIIKEAINKKNPDNLLERIVSGEITTAEEIRDIRKNNSAGAEIFSKTEDELVSPQKTFENIAKALNNLRNKMNGYATNEEIKKLKRIEKLINEVRQ